MTRGGQSERRGRVDFDGRHDGRDELEEHDKVEIDPHAALVLVLPRRLVLDVRTARSTEQPLLAALVLWRGCTEFLGLLFLQSGVHALDDLLHDAGVFAGVDGGGLEGGGVEEGFDCYCLEGVVCGDVLEDLGWC